MEGKRGRVGGGNMGGGLVSGNGHQEMRAATVSKN